VLSSTRFDQTEAELFDGQAIEHRLQKFIPNEDRYEVVHRNLYSVHQRVAASFRKGRAFLAGDAAHVNNPLGGLGLNFGIHDGIELAGLLGCVLRGEASADILDLYERRRRPLNIEFVQQQTVANKKRMEEKDPIARARNFEQLAATAADPVTHRAYLLRASLLSSVKRGPQSQPGPSESGGD
jgi:3-(3-hydroxy-phenyl)propionate hydroxylase